MFAQNFKKIPLQLIRHLRTQSISLDNAAIPHGFWKKSEIPVLKVRVKVALAPGVVMC